MEALALHRNHISVSKKYKKWEYNKDYDYSHERAQSQVYCNRRHVSHTSVKINMVAIPEQRRAVPR
jgi:hypothetical protein